MADFFPGFYPARVCGTEWVVSSKKGTLGLRVDVDVRNAQGVTRAMTGYIWVTPSTLAPSKHTDGTPGRSMVERQLNAIGYMGDVSAAQEIGVSVDLAGNQTRVRLREETYRDEAQLRVASFEEGKKDGGGGAGGLVSADSASVAAKFAELMGKPAASDAPLAAGTVPPPADDDPIPF